MSDIIKTDKTCDFCGTPLKKIVGVMVSTYLCPNVECFWPQSSEINPGVYQTL